MKKSILLLVLITLSLSVNTVFAEESIAQLKQKNSELQAQVDAYKKEREQTDRHLKIFDELDLEAFNNRDMKRIGEIHADNVIVHNPDGTKTSPFSPHEEELKFLFDTFNFKVTDHIVGFGYGEWTAGISISEGKWVKPITLPDGVVLQPTGNKVRLKIATIARWKNGRIAEEYLFWDNKEWNKQIGLK